MRTISAIAVFLVVALASCVIAQDSKKEFQRLRRATQLANAIEDRALRTRALAVLGKQAGNLESALTLIVHCRTRSDKLRMLRKVVSASKFKSAFDRTLTSKELKQIENILGPLAQSEQSGVTLLAMIYMAVNLDRTRVTKALRIIESAPPGKWRDTVYFSAIYALLTRRHLAPSLRGNKLRIDDAKRVPSSFLRQAEKIAVKIETANLRDYSLVLIAMATVNRVGEVDRAMLHIKRISSADLRDQTRLQAVYVLVTGKASTYDSLQVTLSPAELRRFTMHQK